MSVIIRQLLPAANEREAVMTTKGGIAIVLAYVLVSMGVIIAFLLAALATGWFIDRLRERRSKANGAWRRERREGPDRSGAVPIISRTRHPRADPCLARLPRYVGSIGHS